MPNLPIEISNFFLAMQAGPHGRDKLGQLFTEDAEYKEPFSGQAGPHKGREAILDAFQASRSDAFDDAVIELSHVDISGDTITVGWTCFSQAIPGGQGSGINVFQMADGKIISLVTTLDQGDEA